jgi:di/tricarboxylate transporter
MMWLILRPGHIEAASHARLNMQLSLLGRPSSREIAMSLILIGTVAGFNVAPAFGIPTGLVGPIALLAAVLANCFNKQSLQSLNWDFILSYGVILSFSQVTMSLGINEVGAAVVRSMLGDRSVSPVLFVLGMAILAQIVRLVLPDDQALLLLTLALLPTAPVLGLDPWIIVITLLASFSPWFFPAESIGYRVAYEATEERMFTHEQARSVCGGFVALTLLGLTVSVFYWHLIGLL